MVATIFAGTVMFSIAILFLSIGIIFKKKTPLKASCHATVDGGHGGSCACGAGNKRAGDSVKEMNLLEKKDLLKNGKFDLTAVKHGNFIKPD
ncbi:MAG: hypothetical protein JXR91_13435 [Deltaproteobacteria bacterium]|nr:hypothetical protein [Deltaproteobacteria bacterium]